MTWDTTLTPVVDTDGHVTEPPDLWSSRLPSKWADQMPRVEVYEPTGQQYWVVGDQAASMIGTYSVAGWHEYPPSLPMTFDDLDPACFDPWLRLERMDQFGIYRQVLYPNLLGFEIGAFLEVDRELANACTRAYNDFITEWCSADTDRLLPLTMLPLWDVDEAVSELRRGRELGHRGALFGGHPERVGLPRLFSGHWDRVFAEAQDLEVSINFHLGFGKRTKQDAAERVGDWMKRDWDLIDFTKGVCLNFTNNISTVCDLVLGGVCERFPRLTFVSVESGFGWAPFVLDTMDWQWANNGCHEAFPGRLLPSEYFKRQILTTFWFEKSSFDLIEPFADSVMFETDYPHPTSLAPGPASSSRGPRQTIEANLGGLSEETRRKVLFENADRVYAAR